MSVVLYCSENWADVSCCGLQDDSVQILEKREENSGMPQVIHMSDAVMYVYP